MNDWYDNISGFLLLRKLLKTVQKYINLYWILERKILYWHLRILALLQQGWKIYTALMKNIEQGSFEIVAVFFTNVYVALTDLYNCKILQSFLVKTEVIGLSTSVNVTEVSYFFAEWWWRHDRGVRTALIGQWTKLRGNVVTS